MAYADALSARSASGKRPLQGRRANRPSTSALMEDAKLLADILWEDAKDFAAAMRGDAPDDSMGLDEHDSWQILETLAATLPPAEWADPNALTDLFELRKKFTGLEHPELKVLAQQQKRINKLMPDPSITPVSPEFAKMQRRLARSD